MDRLASDAIEARKSGMSYGKWKAMQEPVQVSRKPDEGIPVRRCKACGRAIHPKSGRTKFCSNKCLDSYNYKLDRPSVPKHPEPVKPDICGVDGKH